MAEELERGLWRLDIPLVGNPLKNLNSYLITGERNLLIDTGFRQQPCREAMDRQLEQLHVDLDRTDIFLTHLHSDHSGLSTELIRPGCRIYIGEIDGQWMKNPEKSLAWMQRYEECKANGFSEEEVGGLWFSNPAQTNAPEPYSDYVLVKDGETLEYGGMSLRCVETPGHTPGHMCLYGEENHWFFSGDHVLFHITPNICRWENVEDSLGDYLESLRKIRDLPVSRLLPAHRAETGELSVRVDELLAHHERRLAEALGIVQEHPGWTPYEVASRMKWSIRSRNWEEFPLAQKYFAVGEASAHLDYLACRGWVACVKEGGKNRYYARARA